MPFTGVGFPTQSLGFPSRATPAGMQAYVYKSQRKPDTYVYLAERGFHLQLPPQPLAPVKIARIDGRDD